MKITPFREKNKWDKSLKNNKLKNKYQKIIYKILNKIYKK